MKHLVTLLILAASTVSPVLLFGQKVETEAGDRSRIIYLKTALNHLTVIELREPVVQVATGSQSFKVEWRENKVFVQPTQAETATNLFIWTASERLNYELEPAGAVTSMDFAVDQVPVQPKRRTGTNVTPLRPSPAQFLLGERPVRLESARPGRRPVEVVLRDLYEEEGRLLVRYSVHNRGRHGYEVTTPQVYALIGVRYAHSLYGLAGSQLEDKEARRLKVEQQRRVPVLESDVQSPHLAPGQESLGVVAFRPPASSKPMVLRFQFANDDRGRVAAFLVR